MSQQTITLDIGPGLREILLALIGKLEINAELGRAVVAKLRAIETQLEKAMTGSEEVLALITQIDERTDAIASILADLRNQIRAGMTPAEVDQIKVKLNERIEELQQIGKDPTNPVPEG